MAKTSRHVKTTKGGVRRSMVKENRDDGFEHSASLSDSMTLGARMMTLSNLMRRITALRFQRFFDLALVDGWIISHLGVGGPMSLDQLAYRAGLAKSQMSRGVTKLVSLKLVDRRRNPDNQNEVILTLTASGKDIFKKIKQQWPEYNRLLTTGLSSAENDMLLDLVKRLTDNSRHNLADEQQANGEDGDL
ncbi:MAG: winged helix-turn-helix transcriptional regulator [Rhizobiales bacterium]|nr:winged helix-turn-helix transcriptional regulator [Hyphomicrobiales bacterium]